MNQYKIWVPTGALGAGFPDQTVDYALSQGVDAIACDAGSTDSGPYYLGTGTSTKPYEAVKADLRGIMKARDALSVPLIIGSCGTCGTDSGVDWVRRMCLEIAKEERLRIKLALIYCEQDKSYLRQRLDEGRINALEGALPLTLEVIDSCSHIVGMMGAEPISDALDNGADIILAGRATDTALVAALAMWHGIPAGPAWHGAKIVECGALCTNNSVAGGVIIHFDQDGFEVEAALPESKSTPYSISAHMLYENTDPFILREPAGVLRTQQAVYTAVDERRVRVEGSEFLPREYTVKLEGAGIVGYQSFIMVGMRDGKYIRQIDQWQSRLIGYINDKIKSVLGLSLDEYDIQVRRFGLDGVAGRGLKDGAMIPQELAIMVMATAGSQRLASDIIKLSNAYVLHMPLTLEEELPTFAFPFSPAQIDRGPVYEFKLHHAVEPDDYREMVRTVLIDVQTGSESEK